MLLILCKEARPLWKEVALTWALLLYLTYRDCWRDGYIPDAMEGWLHLLLPLAWSYLTARSLQQPSAGHPRTAQLGAKFLLIVICIHVPYFLSNATVLQARGFALLPYIPDLLQKQMLLFFCLTLPSMALASIVRNATQFIVSAFALAGAAILVYGSGSWPVSAFEPIPWLAPDRVPQNIALLVLALTSASVLWMQYRSRRTLLSANVGLAGVLAAAALYLWLPARLSAHLEGSQLKRAITVRALEPDANLKPFPHFPKNVVRISIPVKVTGLSALDHATLKSLGFELVTTMGLHFSQPTRRTGAKPNFTSLYGFITSTGGDSPSYHLILNMEQSLYDRVATLPVKLKGQLAAEVHRNAMPTALKIDARTDVPNFGKCAVSRVSARTYQDEMLRVACESPNSFPQTQMVLTDTSTGRSRDEPLGGAVTRVSYPTSTWLSSINLREAFFHLTTQADSEWKLPLAILNHYRLEVEPQPSVGKVVADYELAGIDLRRYTPAGR